MFTVRPYRYWPFISKIQKQKPFPDNCACDKCMFFYRANGRNFDITLDYNTVRDVIKQRIRLTPIEQFLYDCFGTWPVLAYKEGEEWYRDRSISECISEGKFDVTGDFVDIVFNKPLVIYKAPVYHIVQFIPMAQDPDTKKWFFLQSPDEIRARCENCYPVWEP